MLIILEVIIIILIVTFGIIPLFFRGAPFLPSYNRKGEGYLDGIINVLEKSGTNKKFIDLGSGDGRVVIKFARRGFLSYGVELNPFLVLWSNLKIKRLGIKSAKILWSNFWEFNLGGFDIIYFFHFNRVNRFLEEKIKREAKENAVIVSVGFPLENFKLIDKEGVFFIYKK